LITRRSSVVKITSGSSSVARVATGWPAGTMAVVSSPAAMGSGVDSLKVTSARALLAG
jgi:hypothetical protein